MSDERMKYLGRHARNDLHLQRPPCSPGITTISMGPARKLLTSSRWGFLCPFLKSCPISEAVPLRHGLGAHFSSGRGFMHGIRVQLQVARRPLLKGLVFPMRSYLGILNASFGGCWWLELFGIPALLKGPRRPHGRDLV